MMSRQSFFRQSACLTVSGALLLTIACASAGRKAKPAHASATTPASSTQTRAQSADPFERTQLDVGLQARVSRPGTLLVTVENRTSHPLLVGPKCFAVIPPGQREAHPVDAQTRQLFPVTEVAPGNQVSGELTFGPELATTGGRLVFNHPETRPAMARIQ